jgi:uncharacterized membrane protein YedE/YeeE
MELIKDPWSWYVAGPIIAIVYTMLAMFGKSFGISSSLRAVCAIAGAGKKVPFFDFDWKSQIWNLMFILGSIIGGFIASQYMSNGEGMILSDATVVSLNELNLTSYHEGIYPKELFNLDMLFSLKGFIIMVLGGLMIGFGTRWAGGCTSGHAISGLANLQVPSLIAVVGFFIGGLIMTHFLLPIILNL